jgi:hypothetical protein
MRHATIFLCSAALVLAGCKPAAEQAQPSNAAAPAETPPSVPARQPAPAKVPAANATAQDRTPLEEPHGPIDPKSVEAAGQIVQSYGALIEQKRWSEANALWGDKASAARFQSDLAIYPDLHLEIGNLGQPEGAAGSIYVTMPVIFYGDAKDGQPFRRSAEVILRRVNDVPGSTEAQRRWHIERIDWAT